MGVHVLLIYLIASIILFFLLNYFSLRKSGIFHYGVMICIYLLFFSGICTMFHLTSNNDTVFLVFIFELLLRIIYVNVVQEGNFFSNKDNIWKYLICFFVVFGLNTFFISKVRMVFLNLEQVKLVIWLLIILYIVYFVKDIRVSHNRNVLVRKEDKVLEKREDVVVQYARLKNKYSCFIHTKYKELIPIIYAIMVYENRNRPLLFRKLDYYMYRFNGRGKKFGVMQIYSKYYIDDENSISIAIRRLEKIYYKITQNHYKDKIILEEYYGKSNVERKVYSILKEIRRFDQM